MDKLTALTMASAAAPGGTFQHGIAKAVTAVLASAPTSCSAWKARCRKTIRRHTRCWTNSHWHPGFPISCGPLHAGRTSRSIQLAERGELRKNLAEQVSRMLKDDRAGEFTAEKIS